MINWHGLTCFVYDLPNVSFQLFVRLEDAARIIYMSRCMKRTQIVSLRLTDFPFSATPTTVHQQEMYHFNKDDLKKTNSGK